MPEEMVTIAKFFSLGEAKLAQGKLSSEGISAFLCDEHTHAINWHMGAAFGGIRLQVPDSQVIRALEILDGFEPEEPEEEEEDTEEVPLLSGVRIAGDSRSGRRESPARITMVSGHSFSRRVPGAMTHHWRCLVCGYQWEEADE